MVIAAGPRDRQFPRSPLLKHLKLDPDLFCSSETNDENDINASSFALSSSAFRSDGLTIGTDFLRLQGVTLTRGLVRPSTILEVHEIIGRGAFSTVRRALWKRRTDTRDIPTLQSSTSVEATCHEDTDIISVAIKEWSIGRNDTSLHATRHRHALLHELRALCTLSATSPALVQLHGAFVQQIEDSNSAFSLCSSTAIVTVVLEYMDRGSLHDYLVHCQSLPEPLIAAVLFQMTTGLAALHAPERRLLHRDLKPSNVLLHSNGAVKLCDFGLTTGSHKTHQRRDPTSHSGKDCKSMLISDMANSVCDDTLMHRTVIGTTQFMAPERLRARPYGRSSDVWSLGLILWQCLSGQTQPYHDASQSHKAAPRSMVDLLVTMEEMTVAGLVHSLEQQRKEQRNHEATTVSAGLQEILAGCLQVEPAKRMPASLLLQSPWFSREQSIHSLDDAVERVRQHLSTYQFQTQASSS